MFDDSHRRVVRAGALAAALLLVGCSGDDGDAAPSTTAEPTTTTAAQTELALRLVTTNGLVGGNVDDVTCDWGTVRYEVVDRNEGDVLAVGDIGPDGLVAGVMPNYECHLDAAIPVP